MADFPAVGLSAVIDNLGEFEKGAGTIKSAYSELNQGASDVETSSISLSGALTNVGGIMQGAFVAAAGAAVVAVGALVGAFAAVGASALSTAIDFQDATKSLIIGTGASGQALEDMEQSVKNLSASAAGLDTSFGDIGAVVAEVNTRTGLTGEALETLSGDILNFSRLTGGDAVKNTQLLTRVMGDWGVSMDDSAQLLDTIFGAGQAFGIGVEDLSAKVVQFGAPLRQMGFSLEESIAMFGKWEKEGVNAELAIGSLRIAAGKFANDNVPLQEGLQNTMDAIKGAATESEALAIAMDVFGARAGPDMAAAIRENRFELEGAIEALRGTEGGLSDATQRTLTFSDQWQIGMKTLRNALMPFGDALLDIINRVMPFFQSAIAKITPIIEGMAAAIGSFTTGIFDKFINGFTDGGSIIDKFSQGITAALTGVLPGAKGAISDLVNAFKNLVTAITGSVPSFDGQTIFGSLISTITNIANTVLPVLTTAINFIANNFETIKNIVIAFGAALAGAAVIGAILSVASAIAALANPIGLVIGAIALLIAAWTNNWLGIRDATNAVWGKIKPIFEEIVKFVKKDLIPFLEELWKSFSKESKKAGKILNQVWGEISKALGPLIEKIFPDLLKIWEEILDWTKKNWPLIKDTIETVMKAIQKVIMTIASQIQSFWEKWGDTIMKIAKYIWDTIYGIIETTMKQILNIIKLIMQVITGDWEGAWETIKDIARTAMEATKENIERTLNLIKDIFSAVLSNILSAVSSAFSSILSAITSAMNSIKSTIESIWSSIVSSVRSYVQQMMSNIISTIQSGISSISSAITNMMNAIISAIQNKISSVVSAIQSMMQSIISTISSKASEIGTAMVNAVTAGVTALLGAITSGNIKTLLVNVGVSIINAIIESIKTVTTLGSELISKVKAGVDALFNTVSSSVGAIGSKLYAIGKELIENIINGLKGVSNFASSIISQLKTWLGGVASGVASTLQSIGKTLVEELVTGFTSGQGIFNGIKDLIKSWVRSWFSPIPEARYVGGEIVGNILQGFNAQKGLFLAQTKGNLLNWMSQLGGMTVPVSSSLSGGSIGALGLQSMGNGMMSSNSTVINNHFHIGGNTINNGMDTAEFDSRVIRTIRNNL